jgi:dTDP-4-dehydrorhamnose 3,5-epimerase
MKKNKFNRKLTAIQGLVIISKISHIDPRGNFTNLFSKSEFKKMGINSKLDSVNYSYTKKRGTFRGFHFQNFPHNELKIVSCIKGEIIDFCLDLRKSSPTYLNYHSEILSGENNRSLVIPEGCAHGFQSLKDDCQLIYFHSNPYVQESEGGVNILDPIFNIKLPIEISEISDKDKNYEFIKNDFPGIKLNDL